MVQYPPMQWRGTDRISTGTRMHEQVRRILSASLIQAEVERFVIEITIHWMHRYQSAHFSIRK
jgi:hypothetical protein